MYIFIIELSATIVTLLMLIYLLPGLNRSAPVCTEVYVYSVTSFENCKVMGSVIKRQKHRMEVPKLVYQSGRLVTVGSTKNKIPTRTKNLIRCSCLVDRYFVRNVKTQFALQSFRWISSYKKEPVLLFWCFVILAKFLTDYENLNQTYKLRLSVAKRGDDTRPQSGDNCGTTWGTVSCVPIS